MEPGTIIAGRYRVQRLVRKTTIGEAYLADDLDSGTAVEIKQVGEPIDPDEGVSAGRVRLGARRRREAEAATLVRSAYVQRAIELIEDVERGPLLVLEWLEGDCLQDRLQHGGPMPISALHPIIADVWRGLAAVHAGGVIHRDLKPSNIVVVESGPERLRGVLRGFDLCKVAGAPDITQMGQSLGALSFMAPEQIGRAKVVDHRADLYACATIIYEMLTGQLPYPARSLPVVVEMKTKLDARALADALAAPVDPRLEAFVARGLARDPAQRFSSALEALEAWEGLAPH